MSIELIITLIGTIISSNALVLILNRKANKRKAEGEASLSVAEARKAEFEIEKLRLTELKEDLDRERQRNRDLMAQNIEKEERFKAQTDRLRAEQDAHAKDKADYIALMHEHTELQLAYKDHKCVDLPCLHREPENEHTKAAKAAAAAAKKKTTTKKKGETK